LDPRRIYPGFAAVEVIPNEVGAVTVDMGFECDGMHGPNYQPDMALASKYIMIGEGARCSLAKQIVRT
jgi:electron-transferring-flavoprotein dehydrogenase